MNKIRRFLSNPEYIAIALLSMILLYTGVIFYLYLNGATKSLEKSIISANLIIFLFLIYLIKTYKTSEKFKAQAHQKIKSLNKLMAISNQALRHDLANKFTCIMQAFELYKLEKNPKFLKECYDSAKAGITIINKMRELDQTIHSQAKLQKYSVSAVIKELKLLCPSVKITTYGQGEVYADPGISTVFENIIQNSIIHGNAKNINVQIVSKHKKCIVKFIDDGKAIPKSIKAKLFNKGFAYGKTANTGLGLYIIKEIMEHYGGTVEISSNEPKGTIVLLTFNSAQ
jgi:signal transduction histidine kinase